MTTRTHHNPPSLPNNPAFSQAVSVEAPQKTIYVGGQNAVTTDGVVEGDIAVQTTQTLRNIEAVLADAGATLEDVVTWTLLVVDGQPLEQGFGAFQEVWGTRAEPPAITMAFVSALAHPAYLVEMSAVAVV